VKIYEVGGAVRDRLLGRPVVDRDWVVVGATPADMEALGFRRVGKEFPVYLHPETGEEYALARTERKTGPGYKGFSFETATTVTLEDDLKRRDLTINAMAFDDGGRLIDPYGGQSDLQRGILRHISPAFVEDPVRVLRVARFSARFGFQIAAETAKLMRDIVAAGELDALVPERVWAELERALGESQPRRFFEALRDCGALAVLFPALDGLFGVPQPAEHHPEIDTGVHTMMVLDQAVRLSPDTRVRFAALVHDLGKGTTPADLLPRHHGHEERSVALIEDFCDRYRVPNDYRELAALVARYHGHCRRVRELRRGTLLSTLKALDAFRRPERFEQFLLACEADARGRLGLEQRPYPQADYFRSIHAAAASAKPQALLDNGLRGEALGLALDQLRLDKITEIHRRPTDNA
jgi:tRNA nucleotidyltransferase (CCA-adding enzyme)